MFSVAKVKRVDGLKILVSIGCVVVFFGKNLFSLDVKITPIADITVGGGQYFYSGSASNGASGDIYFSPVMNFSQDTALLPIYSGSYRGTKDVRELVGGGTLTQETQDHSITLRYITKFTDSFRFRIRGGYKIEYVKETKDETWGKGLFDYTRPSFGVEGEKNIGDKSSLKVGMDYYQMKYPNYKSLISNTDYQTSLDTTTYTELSTNAGENVLDNNNLVLSISYTRYPSENYFWRVGLDATGKNFPEQHVVGENGFFEETLRKDSNITLSGLVSFGNERIRTSISDSIQLYNSNQNSYDASGAKFISSYYSYTENVFAPTLSLNLGEFKPYSVVSFYVELAHRFYNSRPAQTITGEYLSENIYQATQTAGVSFKYPILKNLSAKLSGSYRVSFSNMKYENNYKYNYDVFTYFAGLNWSL